MKININAETEQFTAGFERGIEALDELRIMQLSDEFKLQYAQNHLHNREYERLKRKYGKDNPRTLKAAAKSELGKEYMQAISIVHASASVSYPDPGGGWAVDGYVRDAKGYPVGGVTVAAYDGRERWCEEFGYGCSDEEGYFSIVVEELPEKLPDSVFMRASKGKKLLVSNGVRLEPEPGSSDRVEIIIGDAGSKDDCIPPAGGKEKPRPPDEPVRGKDQPVPPLKKVPAAGESATGEIEKEPLKPLSPETTKLSKISGIGPQRLKLLEEAGIKDVETFVDTDDRKLAEILGDLDFRTMKKDARELLKKK